MNYKFFKCPKCNRVSTAGEWNSATLVLCESEYQKRTFKKIQFARFEKRWYLCPACKEKIKVWETIPLMKTDLDLERGVT